MKYESLVTFSPIFRTLAAELRAPDLSESDTLALLIARHWLTQQGIQYVAMPFALGEDGLKVKAAVRIADPYSEKKNVPQWTCRILGAQGPELKAMWHCKPLPPGYTHLWLWHIPPPDRGEQYAHHWRGSVDELATWEKEGEQYHLALRQLLEEDHAEASSVRLGGRR